MLCAIRESDGKTVIASSQEKQNAPFVCPECANSVTLRKGTFRIHHFAHKPPVTCSYGLGETEEHRRCKTEIFEALVRSPNVTKAALERPLGEVRPDVSACINGVYVAIEVQLSTLSLETMVRRTMEYKKKKIYLLWLAQWTDALEEERYSPRPWELWVHAAYYGRVYYWREGTTITPIHFDHHYRHVEQKDWHDESGDEQSSGGFFKKSKRYRTPKKGPDVDLLLDFRKEERDPFENPRLPVPEALLYCDRNRKFW